MNINNHILDFTSRVSCLNITKSMKILDEKKGIGGEYLKGWVGKALHGHICRNPRNLEMDLRRERRREPDNPQV
jgi:hypothetical protein